MYLWQILGPARQAAATWGRERVTTVSRDRPRFHGLTILRERESGRGVGEPGGRASRRGGAQGGRQRSAPQRGPAVGRLGLEVRPDHRLGVGVHVERLREPAAAPGAPRGSPRELVLEDLHGPAREAASGRRGAEALWGAGRAIVARRAHGSPPCSSHQALLARELVDPGVGPRPEGGERAVVQRRLRGSSGRASVDSAQRRQGPGAKGRRGGRAARAPCTRGCPRTWGRPCGQSPCGRGAPADGYEGCKHTPRWASADAMSGGRHGSKPQYVRAWVGAPAPSRRLSRPATHPPGLGEAREWRRPPAEAKAGVVRTGSPLPSGYSGGCGTGQGTPRRPTRTGPVAAPAPAPAPAPSLASASAAERNRLYASTNGSLGSSKKLARRARRRGPAGTPSRKSRVTSSPAGTAGPPEPVGRSARELRCRGT